MNISHRSLISVEEYLSTSYHPDREYLEGLLVERNVGEQYHSWMQALLIGAFFARRAPLAIMPLPAQRVQVKPERFRVPDVCVVRRDDTDQIIQRPPVLCIEILAKDDSMSGVEDKVNDYLQFGVPTVWVIDPRTRRGFMYTPGGIRTEALDAILRAANPGYRAIELPMSELAE